MFQRSLKGLKEWQRKFGSGAEGGQVCLRWKRVGRWSEIDSEVLGKELNEMATGMIREGRECLRRLHV